MMAYDPGAIETALASALGDSAPLIDELRSAFFASATTYVDRLRNATTLAEWHDGADRLKGLAASFGAERLMAAATALRGLSRIDPTALRKVDRCIALLRD
jgi:histidine phosphotransfer protein HptB